MKPELLARLSRADKARYEFYNLDGTDVWHPEIKALESLAQSREEVENLKVVNEELQYLKKSVRADLAKSPMSKAIMEWLKDNVIGVFLFDDDGNEVNVFDLPEWLHTEHANAYDILGKYLDDGVIPFENEKIKSLEAELAKCRAMLKKHQYRDEHCVECGVFFADGCPSRCAYAELVKEV